MFKCKNCSSIKFKKIVHIGKQPLSGIFLKKKTFRLKKYSLDLFECKNCKLVQLKEPAKAADMFGQNYEYSTALSSLMINHKILEEFKKFEQVFRNILYYSMQRHRRKPKVHNLFGADIIQKYLCISKELWDRSIINLD